MISAEHHYSPPLMGADPAPSLTRHGLIPLSLVVCFVLVYVVKAAPAWVVLVGAPMVALYLLAPRWGRASLRRFDREVVGLLAKGRHDELSARFGAALGMRLFAPPAMVAERRGRVAFETGELREARAAFRAAMEGYPEDQVPAALLLGMGHASFALGEDRDAIEQYRAVLRQGTRFPRVTRNLARALARRGEELKDAERLADEGVREATGDPEARLVRALVHASRGQRGPARKILRATAEAENLDDLREEIEVALLGD